MFINAVKRKKQSKKSSYFDTKEVDISLTMRVLHACLYFRIKRFLDFILSLMVLVVLSPFLILLTIAGAVAMKGNPFFVQKRPGMISNSSGHERIIRVYKFRTMTNDMDSEGNLLPDEKRLSAYGKFLRSTSCDELPSLIGVLIGNLSIVGPRPLLMDYLPYYTNEERIRHTVRPGLTGLAQINGRNHLDWDMRLALDVEYVKTLSFLNDMKIIVKTVEKVIKRADVSETRITPLDLARKSSVIEKEN